MKGSRAISLKIERREKATCEACGEQFRPRRDGSFEVSPHLRDRHGFTNDKIVFEITSEVICPPMTFMEARQ